MAESNIKLRVDARDAVNALQRTNRATTQLNQTLRTTNKRTATATANIQRFGISFRSVVGPMVALTGAVTLASRSLSTFASREADLKVLSAQLSRIGADGTNQLDTLKAAADRLGDATLFSQDDFIEAFNVLSSFRAIAVTSFTEVSEVAADIAQVMGTDVKSATVQLAKALEDPKRGLTALSRSGITFNETQTETIKKLVDSGKLLKAQNLILETIKGQYEGAATAAGTGFAGAQDLLAENTADLTEALGKGLEPAAAAVTTKFAELAGLLSKIPTPAGQAALAIGGVALALKAVNTAIIIFKGSQLAAFIGTQIALYKTFGAQIYLTAAAQGVLNKAVVFGRLALLGLPFAIVTGALTFYIAELARAKIAQAEFNNLLDTGTEEQLNQALATEKATLALIRQRKEKKKNAIGGRVGFLSFGETIEEGRSERRIEKILKTLQDRISKRSTPRTPTTNTVDLDKLTKQVDASKELVALNNELFNSARPLKETEKILLEFLIQKQQIIDSNLGAGKKEIAMLQAKSQFEERLTQVHQDHLDLQKEAADLADAERKKREDEEKRRREADPGFQMKKQLEELVKLENQVAAGATAIGNAFSSSFKSVITGSKSAEQALADMMASVAEHFLDMAAQIIAKQIAMILYGTIMKALGVGLPSMGSGEAGVGQMADMGSIGMGGPGIVENKLGQGFGTLGPNFGIRQYAEGGFVTGPTNAVIGEGGEPEYIIPQSKMRESMQRYSRGARGGAVIPAAGDSVGSGAGGGVAVAAPIDVRFNVERINNVDYVTAAEFQEGMQQAAKQGAQRGEQQAIKRLQMSSSTRRRVGL